MARDIARVVLVGRLTRDPELQTTAGGTPVCRLGVAVNSSTKDASGQWVEKPSFFDVKVFGAQGENSARYLAKGRQVAIDGRLDQSSWETPEGAKRSKVEIIADSVMFIGGQGDSQGGGGSRAGYGSQEPRPQAQDPDFKDIDFGGEDDIPF